jgi:hypothetical protein
MSSGCPLVAVKGNVVVAVVMKTKIVVVVVGRNLANHLTMSGMGGLKSVVGHSS